MFLVVEEVFTFTDKGSIVVVSGIVKGGTICIGQKVSWILEGVKKTAVVKGIEQKRRLLFLAKDGDEVGILLEGVDKGEIRAKNKIYALNEYVESMLISDSEKEIATYRFGLEGDREHTTEETSEYFKIPVIKVKLVERRCGKLY